MHICPVDSIVYVAPLTGAWIEIERADNCELGEYVAPLTGAWIEIVIIHKNES